VKVFRYITILRRFYETSRIRVVCHKNLQIPTECVEIFNYLLNEPQQIKLPPIDEEFDPAEIAILQRPISEWENILKDEGFNIETFGEFILSAEANLPWKGKTSITKIYQQSIQNNSSTGDFLSIIYSQAITFWIR